MGSLLNSLNWAVVLMRPGGRNEGLACASKFYPPSNVQMNCLRRQHGSACWGLSLGTHAWSGFMSLWVEEWTQISVSTVVVQPESGLATLSNAQPECCFRAEVPCHASSAMML